jgi:hypothetical protein
MVEKQFIKDRIKKLTTEFEKLKAEIIEAEKFILISKEKLMAFGGAYQELLEIEKFFNRKEETEEKVIKDE